MNEENKRKTIILTFIGALTLLFVVVGGTFAYFQIVNTGEGETKSTLTGETEGLTKYGTPTLTQGTNKLHINLKASDMAVSKSGTEYWATNVEEKDYETGKQQHIISTAGISGAESEDTELTCTSELTIKASGSILEDTNPLVEEDGYVYLGVTSETSGNKGKINPAKIDIKQIVDKSMEEGLGYQTEISYTIKGNSSINITADIDIINRNADQNSLAGKSINFTITNQNLSCSVKSPSAPGTKLEGKSNLTTELINGMYRYQGNSIIDLPSEEMEMPNVTDTVDNNYICLGTNCTIEDGPVSRTAVSSDDDMYRIIGITPDNVIKVVKMKAIDGTYQWANDSNTDTPWNESKIYKYLNEGPYESGGGEDMSNPTNKKYPITPLASSAPEGSYLSTLSSNLQDKILNYQWKYGTVGVDEEKFNEVNEKMQQAYEDEALMQEAYKEMAQLLLDAIESEEEKATSQIEAKIGLMSASDYCYSFESGSDINCVTSMIGSETGELGMSWLSPMNNDSEISWEWTMTYFGLLPATSNYTAWLVDAEGGVDYRDLIAKYTVRPSFYLASDIELTGEGTKTNPYRIQGLEG